MDQLSTELEIMDLEIVDKDASAELSSHEIIKQRQGFIETFDGIE